MVVSASGAFLDAPVPLAVVALRHGRLAEIRLANRAFAELVHRDREDLVGLPLEHVVHPDDAVALETPADALAGAAGQHQIRVFRGDWAVVWTVLSVSVRPLGGSESSAVVALQDLTLRLRIEEELSHRATHDWLTGLSNRSLLIEHLELVLAQLHRRSGHVAVLFCDLDGFKRLNDTYGHRVGDEVLRETAGRILQSVRSDDVVVRMGGDEFVIICQASGTDEARLLAERVRTAIAPPMLLQDREVAITVSVGVASAAEPSADPEDLIRRADLAMYAAKQAGRDQVVAFAPGM